ncbi:MAG: helix-turn-helix domain-containing protein [Hyphomonadaceae bacterium]|nr:helix-turn-helix domain-containing protein [Hyphomonadaceae bacterium]
MKIDAETIAPPAPLAVDTQGAAKLLGVSPQYLEKLRYLEAEHGPPFMRFGRKVLYRVSDLEAYAESLLVGGGR